VVEGFKRTTNGNKTRKWFQEKVNWRIGNEEKIMFGHDVGTPFTKVRLSNIFTNKDAKVGELISWNLDKWE